MIIILTKDELMPGREILLRATSVVRVMDEDTVVVLKDRRPEIMKCETAGESFKEYLMGAIEYDLAVANAR